MFVDASVIVAMMNDEPDGALLSERLDGDLTPLTSGLALFEAVLAVSRTRRSTIEQARGFVDEFVHITGVEIIGISPHDAQEAIGAFNRFGKGRHRAALNMGDCFAYACAKSRSIPLLCKGDDFIHTDIEIA